MQWNAKQLLKIAALILKYPFGARFNLLIDKSSSAVC